MAVRIFGDWGSVLLRALHLVGGAFEPALHGCGGTTSVAECWSASRMDGRKTVSRLNETSHDSLRWFELPYRGKQMRFLGVKIGSFIGLLFFALANLLDYSVQRTLYFDNLKESGMTWAGAWFWGKPFAMFYSGAGVKGDEWGIEPFRFLVNAVILVALIMFLGVVIEKCLDRFRFRDK